jgi:hypothetical protein
LFSMLSLGNLSKAQPYYYNHWYNDSPTTWELSAGAGGMNCFTDLGGRKGNGRGFIKDLNLVNTRFCAGLYLGILYENTIGARLELTCGKITAYDSILKDHQAGRYRRNLHFRSIIMELALLAEFHPLNWLAYASSREGSRFSPYLLAGVGVFTFNPQAQINGNWIFLNALHTEGQGFTEYPNRKPYKLTQCNIPAGIGLKYEISSLLNMRIEVIHRILFTDYLDDVSTSYISSESFYRYFDPWRAAQAAKLADRRNLPQPPDNQTNEKRGNPGKNDAWFSIQVRLGILLNRIRK